MDLQITEKHVRLQQRCRQLAEDFATRAAQHDREASDPVENYALLRQAGFYALNVPQGLGGWGMGLLGYALAAEELAQGCPSTALASHCSALRLGPIIDSCGQATACVGTAPSQCGIPHMERHMQDSGGSRRRLATN